MVKKEIFVTVDFSFTTLTIHLIQKIMQVSSIFFATCFTIVGTLSLIYLFTYLKQLFE
jgi:hypothetical protein